MISEYAEMCAASPHDLLEARLAVREIGTLPDRERAVMLRRLLGDTYAEAGEVLSISVEDARRLVWSGRSMLVLLAAGRRRVDARLAATRGDTEAAANLRAGTWRYR